MSPRLILHIGQPKTGTTTLQKSLQASRPALADDNILHPCTGLHHNHRVLLPYLADKGPAFSNAKSIKASRLAWNGVLHDSRNTMPKIIIISSEQFYHVADDNAVKNILSHLYSLSEELVISCYVREPASSALSRFQQNIKRTPKFKLRSNSYYRDTLESYLNKCPESLRVREFNRRTLRRGDIVGDFFSSHIPHFDQDKITRVKNANTTMSAEAMALMQEINREERSLPTASALKTIVKVDREIGGYSRPRMHTQIRQAIQARCTDLS